MSLVATPGLAVNRLRVVDHGRDALRARLAADRLISAAQPTVPGLPAGAILVIKQLSGPMPARGAPVDSPAAVARWRTELEAELVALWRSAARPAREPVPHTATAVLFADYSELLACLAADWALGVASARWWWASLTTVSGAAAVSSARGFVALLGSHAADLPATFEQLARRGLAARVARVIPPDAALSLALATAREHRVPGVSELAVSMPGRDGTPCAGSAPTASPASPGSDSPGSGSPGMPVAAAPWAASVPEAAGTGLAAAQRLLLGVTLVIRRDPAVARARGFRRAIEAWWRDGAPPPEGHGEAALPRAVARVAPARTMIGDSVGLGRPAPPVDLRATAPGQGRGITLALTSPPRQDADPGEPHDPRLLEPDDSPPGASDPGVRTRLAGVFYLLNVGLFLGCYGDFTMPRDPGLTLDPWDFAVLIARRLLRRADDRDPVWRLLAELSGHERAGAGFRAPRCWRVPVAWLEPFDGARGPWRWAVSGGRLLVLHPAGFVAIDVPASEDSAGQLRRELARLGVTRRPRRVSDPEPADPARGAARWVGWIAGYIGVRLRIALGARTAGAAAAALLERPGTVRVTPSRVDVTFALDDLPIAIRLAGLDRSPGWIPAARRRLAFHFA